MEHLAQELGRTLRFALTSSARALRLCLVLAVCITVGSLWWLIWILFR